MNYNAYDLSQDPIGRAHELKAAGVDYVGLYMREDRCSPETVQGLRSVGIKIWSIFETGEPTNSAYFTVDQAKRDAEAILAYAQVINMPDGKAPFAAVDHDAYPADVFGYFEILHSEMTASERLLGVYGSGAVCKYLKTYGLVHYTWLAQSRGWGGYMDWFGNEDITQYGDKTPPLGLNGDPNVVRNKAVLW